MAPDPRHAPRMFRREFIAFALLAAFLLGFVTSPFQSVFNEPCRRGKDIIVTTPAVSPPLPPANQSKIVPRPVVISSPVSINNNPYPKLLTYTNRTTVILTASVHVNARKSPYILLILPVAHSWAAQGFEVVVVLVFYDAANTPPSEIEFFQLLKQKLRAIPNVQVLTFPAPNLPAEISLSQVVRLFLPVLLDDWPDHAYIRLSDSDMMIFKNLPFEATNPEGIDIYNGDCCWPEVPMHSIGMTKKLWVSLFEHYLKEKPEGEPTWNRYSLSLAIMKLLKERFSYDADFVGHGKKFWGMDQIMAGEKVSEFKKNGGILTTSPAAKRAHWPFTLSSQITECHLAGITFDQMTKLHAVVGDLGSGLDVLAAKYNSTWLSS